MGINEFCKKHKILIIVYVIIRIASYLYSPLDLRGGTIYQFIMREPEVVVGMLLGNIFMFFVFFFFIQLIKFIIKKVRGKNEITKTKKRTIHSNNT